MAFPEAITTHGDVTQGGIFKYNNPEWQVRKAEGNYGIDKRHCSFCGSLHPEDLVALLTEGGAKLELADQKYGWPHKFYVTVPNPKAGEPVKGSQYPAPQTLQLKFYNEHLRDLKDTPDEFTKVAEVIYEFSGIAFFMDPQRGLVYRRG